ncbi:L-type lectin-domain containing receptor kinase IV.1-like isoform X1 [Papaver somniferum]|uniref:L-type lectin-domain containing receptor kinase IV.1-like isoform X1 n=2 Tax=Papaver somniferum TaxID=3469 RepID=UPI000E6F5425|nr:L-type lectin-domain containing receptor kinase IV.1-like isoform X1 [Papaver somniferum]
MFFKFAILFFFLIANFAASEDLGFVYNGFKNAPNLSLDGVADITENGLLRLTNDTKQRTGHAFYSDQLRFKIANKNSMVSFSTSFAFAIVSEYRDLSGHGIAFVVAPHREFPGALPSQYLGLFNESTNGNITNHVVAVELDTIENSEFDINNNHVGIDINDLKSVKSSSAMYFTSNGNSKNLSLISGQPMLVWIEYDGLKKQLNVTLAPIKIPKPDIPLLSLSQDLSAIVNDSMYVGFSSSTGSVLTSHYILGWSFQINGEAQAIDISRLPKLPRRGPKKKSKMLSIGLPIVVPFFVLVMVFGVFFIIRRKRKFAELIEDWELNYVTQRFSYKDLYIATKGFKEKEVLGIGGFGKVYKGVLPGSKIQIAVKKVSHDSRQGIREFIAEIVSIGQLRHRNLVQLLGYCRRQGELLLVYDYMPNGSLDRFVFRSSNSASSCSSSPPVLNWTQRFQIIKGVASGLFYLHEGWEQVVIHRDIKASNVLLDAEMNARVGDFGLARLYDRGTNPQTTNVVGTLGYIAPELTRTGKATTSTDVFGFGAFLLEVGCGRRPIELQKSETEEEGVILVDWVYSCWSKGGILQTSDPNLKNEYEIEEMELVLKLGLLCSHNDPKARPTMRQVVQYLEKDAPLPQDEMLALEIGDSNLATNVMVMRGESCEDFAMSYPGSVDKVYTGSSSSAVDSLLSGSRS